MGATVPNCSYDYTYPYGHCPCTPNCPNYVSAADARNITIAFMDIMNKDENRCSNCGNFLKTNEGTIIAGRCRMFILCSECKDKIDDFVKWGDEE